MSFTINKVAVIGAGVMGAGIAAHIAGAGIPVCLLDIVPNKLTEKEEKKGLTLESPLVRNRFAIIGKEKVTNPKNRSIYSKDMGNLIEVGNITDDLEKLKDCDWIIEVIVENLQIKKNLMKNISKFIKPGTIISTNTSGVSITKIAEDMSKEFKANFLGTHFFNPPRYMKLFEIIPTEDTSKEVIDFMTEFGTKRLGKGIVLAKDTPNFIGNRIGTYAYIDVLKLMEKYNYSVPKIDQLTGTIIGRPKSATFRTLDMVGLDIVNHVADNVITNSDDELEKKQFEIPKFELVLLEKGYLGDKTRQGFYKKVKTPKGRQVLAWDINKEDYTEVVKEKIEALEIAKKEKNPLKAFVYGDLEENKFAWELVSNLLIYSASKIPEIADDFTKIDNAMKWGYNWKKGPFEIWDVIGFEESVKKMKTEGRTLPQWIEDKLNSGDKGFYNNETFETPFISLKTNKNIIKSNKHASLKDLGDGVACLEFTSKGNTITDEVMDMMFESINDVEKNYKGMVIGNQSKNFSAGANLVYVGGLAKEQKWDELSAMVDRFQQANLALKYCKKPVVAAPYGMTLGGGAEIVMHSHKVMAHAETYMGLVEVGVGLIPGGGGTKELLYRNVENLVKPTNGEMIPYVKKAWESIAMAKVSSSGHDAINKGYMRKSDEIVMSADYLIDEAKKAVLQLYDNGFRPLQTKPVKVLGTSGKASLKYFIDFMLRGQFISEYDAFIAEKIANILTGGNVPAGSSVSEQQILDLEKEAFVSLCGEEKTLQRMEYMVKKGKPLRN